eukprot:m.31883 g.31883  ORF g.31883 m.31883 type:complete len:254 (-) comp9739_c0_seq1:568-1329(-)
MDLQLAVKTAKDLKENPDKGAVDDFLSTLSKQVYPPVDMKKAGLLRFLVQLSRKLSDDGQKKQLANIVNKFKVGARRSSSSSSSTSKTGACAFPLTNDTVRDNMRRMIVKNLIAAKTKAEEEKALVTLACDVESAIFAQFKVANKAYQKECIGRHGLIKGAVKVKLLSKELSVNTFLKKDKKSFIDKKIIEEAMEEEAKRKNPGSKPGNRTSMLTCGKCGSKECQYKEMQTRSADEPMTVFATCCKCGFRWRQ